MRRRRTFIMLALIAVLSSVLGLTTAARAQPTQLQDNNGGSSLCWNRSGAGTGTGTHVIAYNCGYSNNDFDFLALSTMCGGGLVTQVCPFVVGSGLNKTYANLQIVAIESPSTGLCVGGSSSSDGLGSLQACPGADGTGGGDGTIAVLEPGPFSNGHLFYVLVNREWSDWYVTHSNPQCNAFTCTLVDGAPNGYQTRISLQDGDAAIRSGNPNGAAYWNLWAEV